MKAMLASCVLLMLASSACARCLHGAGGRPAGQDKGAGNDGREFLGKGNGVVNKPETPETPEEPNSDEKTNSGRHVGHKFKFDKEPRGAAGFLDDMDAQSPGKLQRIIAKSKWQGGKDELAKELEHDTDLGIDLDNEALLYQCESLASAAPTTAEAAGLEILSGVLPGDIDPASVQAFALSSRPSATRKVYLDFIGGSVTNTAWNVKYPNINIPAFSVDGDLSTFSTVDNGAIYAIWRAVSEDYAAFDVDITTIRPASFEGVHRIMIGGAGEWYSANPVGGVSYTGGFKNSFYNPGFVFAVNLGRNYPKYVWEAVSHELGHGLGLAHDTTNAGAYFEGQGDWAPIMGYSYLKAVTTFDKGEYTGASNMQDDFAVISNTLPLLPQDNNNMAAATPLTVAAATVPGSVTGTAYGIISQPDVPEFFSFTATAAGPATFSVAVVSPYGGSARSNLDVQLAVFDATGASLGALNPAGVDAIDGLGIANARLTLPAAGTYYVALTGAGAGDVKATGYSSYGSRGQFGLTVTIPTPMPSPSPSPSPSPAPAALPLARASIAMSKSCKSGQCTCSATVTVTASRSVSNLAIGGSWTTPSGTQIQTATISSRGQALFTASRQSTRTSCTFTLTTPPAGYAWDPASMMTGTLTNL